MMQASQRRRRRTPSQAAACSAFLVLTLSVSALAQTESEQQRAISRELEQERILIKGNQGLPTTLFIAPWKKVRGKVPEGGPLESRVDQSVEPVDQEVFRRKLELYDQGYPVN